MLSLPVLERRGSGGPGQVRIGSNPGVRLGGAMRAPWNEANDQDSDSRQLHQPRRNAVRAVEGTLARHRGVRHYRGPAGPVRNRGTRHTPVPRERFLKGPLNGFELCRAIRRLDAHQHTPIILMLSGHLLRDHPRGPGRGRRSVSACTGGEAGTVADGGAVVERIFAQAKARHGRRGRHRYGAHRTQAFHARPALNPRITYAASR